MTLNVPFTVALIACSALLCAGCQVARVNHPAKGDFLLTVGGKGYFNRPVDGGENAWGMRWDNEKSFRDGMIAGTVVAGGAISAAASKAQVAQEQATARAADRARVDTTRIGAGVETARIGADVQKTQILAEGVAR